MNEISETEYRKLKQEVERAKSEAERAKGALEQTITVLKRDFGVDNIKDAKVKLAELSRITSIAQKKFQKAYSDYQAKWNENDGE